MFKFLVIFLMLSTLNKQSHAMQSDQCYPLINRPSETDFVQGAIITYNDEHLSKEDAIHAIMAIFESQKENPPYVFLQKNQGNDDEIKQLVNSKIEKLSITLQSKNKMKKALRFVTTSSAPSAWNQDFLHINYGPGDGRSRLYFVKNYDDSKGKDNHTSAKSSFLQMLLEINSAARKENLINSPEVIFQEMPEIDVGLPHAGHYGGNTLTLPGGYCGIGLSKFNNEAEARAFSQKVCSLNSDSQSTLVVDTSWLSVSHIDEVIGVLQNLNPNKNECSEKVILPSPDLAFQLLKSHPTERFIPLESVDYGFKGNEVASIRRIPILDKLCKKKFGADYDPAKCIVIKNEDFLNNLPKEFLEVNRLAKKKLLNIEKSLNQFYENKKCLPKIEKVPVLFDGDILDGKLVGASTILPNSINLVPLKDRILVPKSGNSIFDKNTSDLITRSNLKIEFLNTFRANRLGGNAHCMIKAIRKCVPLIQDAESVRDPQSTKKHKK